MSRWKLHGERIAYANKWLRVVLKDVELPSGARFDMHTIDLQADASGVVVVDPERGVLLVWQHRIVRDDFGWEIPAGRIDPGETPEQAVTLAWYLEDAARVELAALAAGMAESAPRMNAEQAAQRATWQGRIAERMWEHLSNGDPE